jgi:hypothetical protein
MNENLTLKWLTGKKKQIIELVKIYIVSVTQISGSYIDKQAQPIN